MKAQRINTRPGAVNALLPRQPAQVERSGRKGSRTRVAGIGSLSGQVAGWANKRRG